MPFSSSDAGLLATFAVSPVAASNVWTLLTVADNGSTLAPGNYHTDSSGGSFTVLLDGSTESGWLFLGRGEEDDNNITIGAATDSLSFYLPETDLESTAPGPFIFDATGQARIISTTANTYRVVVDSAAASEGAFVVQAVQTADFTATAGDGNCYVHPVDLSARAAVSELVVTMPQAAEGKCFQIKDALNTITSTRTIRINPQPTDSIDGMLAGDYAVMNEPANNSRGLGYTFVGLSATEWMMYTNENE